MWAVMKQKKIVDVYLSMIEYLLAAVPTLLDFCDYARRKPIPIGALDYGSFLSYIFFFN